MKPAAEGASVETRLSDLRLVIADCGRLCKQRLNFLEYSLAKPPSHPGWLKGPYRALLIVSTAGDGRLSATFRILGGNAT